MIFNDPSPKEEKIFITTPKFQSQVTNAFITRQYFVSIIQKKTTQTTEHLKKRNPVRHVALPA